MPERLEAKANAARRRFQIPPLLRAAATNREPAPCFDQCPPFRSGPPIGCAPDRHLAWERLLNGRQKEPIRQCWALLVNVRCHNRLPKDLLALTPATSGPQRCIVIA